LGIMQFYPHSHQGFYQYLWNFEQSYQKRCWVYEGTNHRLSFGSIHHSENNVMHRTNHGLPKIW
jgi:hypothetical protein